MASSRSTFPAAGPSHDINGAAVGQAPYRVNVTELDLGLDGYATAGPLDDGSSSSFVTPQQQQQHRHHHQASPGFGRPATSSQQQQQNAVAAAVGSSSGGGQFGILAPATVPLNDAFNNDNGGGLDVGHPSPSAGKGHGGRMVIDPPDLETWRERLFSVDDMIVLTNDQFETYFPHVDNVYSHRSTQRYKRKPFVSHYWDCRMKGRPPGTPKSEDPNKKKRKRTARERDLCDVKIKITEYAPGAQIMLDPSSTDASTFVPPPVDVGTGQRFWTIQRVNGNGGNGKGDGVAGPHRHTLAKSDEIKKNSIQRYIAQQERETKKNQKPVQYKASGAALATVRKHGKESDLKLYAACYCPFSQRVWIALEAKGMAYQYCEMDPYRRPAPTQLLEANPRGKVPAIRQGAWACAESGIILEYLEDLDTSMPLHPTDPRLKANCRLWIEHIDSQIVAGFFNLLKTDDIALQSEVADGLQNAITRLVLAADESGPFFLGGSLSLVDVHLAPFALRLSRVLQPLRSWPDPIPETRWHRWLQALEGNAHVRATTSGSELYTETTELLTQKLGPGQG